MLAVLVAVSFFILTSVLVWIASLNGVASSVLVRDPAAEFQFPFYAGLISYLGVALLIATAAITGFASRIVTEHAMLLGLVSLFSGILAFDDLFILHEFVMPLIFGVPETAVYAAYAVLFAVICWRISLLRKRFSISGYFVALLFLGASVSWDILEVSQSPVYWFEDALKIAGFGAWMTFWVQFSGQLLSQRESL